MAQQIFRPHVYGNFKPSQVQKEKTKRAAPKKRRESRTGNSDAHKAAICKLPCLIPGCTVVGVEPHHLKHGPAARERSVGRKATDRWLLPLCHNHHINGVEIDGRTARTEPKWFRDQGIAEPIEIAAALWSASPNASAMARIILTHKGLLRQNRGEDQS
ncbi:hypothetical protein Hden_1171 [Hyphomicrobium denitrificans ATCC 51888]|uniref:DUF968 domain-containing protein n=1 Tax=Hyphomicrobium denitrificans (strain ATCC 51888 / DSM 1869 / NCIMB 11706 / TK 0415) TaxID=582899 RepID=D8JVU5_HYPDA|nr:hypothetical protein [Hyphomicrobium denitrificans]ADJ22984.1 hypothetical protein Hden_1171 [Hyphomicrobium denitrificans ATCC 51888]